MPILGGQDERKVEQPQRKTEKNYSREDDIAAQLLKEDAYKDYCNLKQKEEVDTVLSKVWKLFGRS